MADQDFNIKVVTTADTSGLTRTREEMVRIRQEAEKARQDAGAAALFARIPPGATQKPTAPTATEGDAGAAASSIGRAGGFIAAGAIYELINGLKKASEEIIKISDELDKQGAQLVLNAQKIIESATHTKDEGDALKISDAALKDIAATQKTVNELVQQELGYAATISDYLQKQLLARQRASQQGDYEAAQAKNLETAIDQMLSARQRGMQEVLASEKAQNQTTEEHLATINREIQAEERRKSVAASNTDPGGYVKAANNLSRLKKELADLIALEEKERQVREKQQEAAYGAASPQAKAILENEKRARETGDSAFQKTADQLRKSANPADLAAVQAVSDTYGKAARPGRAAGVGESQDLVDEQERQRIAAENAQKATPQPGGETGSGGPSLIGAAAERARRQGIEQTGKDSKDASAEKLDLILTWMKQVWGY